ncbi:hypothetical protein FS749_014604 [Ceratobasidium sp. UAMH 11750]|nr:hypothetical protein FS749_014604 [Ceratobasidium sp. UAMH 11750]
MDVPHGWAGLHYIALARIERSEGKRFMEKVEFVPDINIIMMREQDIIRGNAKAMAKGGGGGQDDVRCTIPYDPGKRATPQEVGHL